ncbi:MAG TPA: glycosyltransferase family 39 protein [Anaerolineales bacterium]|nr:glycosyltransferase family 39 protein [Anaerolineales bacterium]
MLEKRLASRTTLLWLALPLAVVLLILLFFPFRFRIEFDADEGVNAIKAMMVLRGYRLYGDIWSDQPPLFTYLLAGWFQLLGLRAAAGRLLVLLFSAALVAAAADYLRRSFGSLAAGLCAATLFMLPFFPRLSVSMMIGLPAISLAMLSFYALARWHEQPRPGWLLASALLLGSSVLTKGFTVILAPIWFIGIAVSARRNGEGRSWLAPALWSVVLGAMGIAAIFIVIGLDNLDQLVNVHLQAGQTEAFRVSAVHPPLEYFLRESVSLFVLSIAGVWRAVQARRWTAMYLAAWLGAGYALLTTNSPAWYHHQLLITIPAAMLACIAVAAGVHDLRAIRTERPTALSLGLSLASIALFLVFVSVRGPSTVDGLDLRLPNLTGPSPGEEAERELLGVMGNHVEETNWLYTDRPMFAFLTRLPVPPNLAVITAKRLETGQLTDEEVLATLEAYKPEMILNARFSLPVVQEYMRTRNYTRIDETMKYRLYFRKPPP